MSLLTKLAIAAVVAAVIAVAALVGVGVVAFNVLKSVATELVGNTVSQVKEQAVSLGQQGVGVAAALTALGVDPALVGAVSGVKGALQYCVDRGYVTPAELAGVKENYAPKLAAAPDSPESGANPPSSPPPSPASPGSSSNLPSSASLEERLQSIGTDVRGTLENQACDVVLKTAKG